MDVVKQAVLSAYPSARLEEVSEHNIFNEVGKISSISGGELVLKEPFGHPIATYQDLKRDAMQSILNSLSTLTKEDGVGIQILMRPADSSWRKTASALAESKRKGKKKGTGWDYLAQFAMAFVKTPEEKKDNKPEKELSAVEQNNLDAIDDKTRYPGYETLIRIIVSSNVSQRSQSILSNIVAAFSLFDAPGRNGFKFVAAKDPKELTSAYLMRLFPQNDTANILNSVDPAHDIPLS